MTAAPATILIVEDDADIRRLVGELLVREGFLLAEAESAEAMDLCLQRTVPDLVILDLMLPGEDGLSICRRLRAQSDMPILILSAKADEIDRVIGLELGADDYLVKPFGPRELLARVRALLRRGRGAMVVPIQNRRLAFESFIVDLDARQVTASGADVLTLTTAEFDLLACFVQSPRRVLSRDQILDRVSGRSADPFDRTVDMLVSRLRRKLSDAGAPSGLVSTVRNGGYLFTAQVRQVP